MLIQTPTPKRRFLFEVGRCPEKDRLFPLDPDPPLSKMGVELMTIRVLYMYSCMNDVSISRLID